MNILETDRLLLRTLAKQDAPLLHSFFSDPETMRFYPSTRSKTQTEEFIERQMQRYANDGLGPWAVVLKPEKNLIGYCGLVKQVVDSKEEIEIGYLIAREHWRNGYASEAARGCRDYGFLKLKLRRLISIIDPENVASIGVALKVGMTLEKKSFWQGKRMNIYSVQRTG